MDVQGKKAQRLEVKFWSLAQDSAMVFDCGRLINNDEEGRINLCFLIRSKIKTCNSPRHVGVLSYKYTYAERSRPHYNVINTS